MLDKKLIYSLVIATMLVSGFIGYKIGHAGGYGLESKDERNHALASKKAHYDRNTGNFVWNTDSE